MPSPLLTDYTGNSGPRWPPCGCRRHKLLHPGSNLKCPNFCMVFWVTAVSEPPCVFAHKILQALVSPFLLDDMAEEMQGCTLRDHIDDGIGE